jgi:hypothetical protein
MNRFVRAAAAAAVLVAGAGSTGCLHGKGAATSSTGTAGDCGAATCNTCGGAAGNAAAVNNGRRTCGDCYRNWVDPSWPERYNSVARAEVVAPFAAQVNNGHVLNQTLWNWYFEPGTDKLNEAGIQKLDSLARTRPATDTKLYIQTARDLAVTPDTLNVIADNRMELNARRAEAIRRYMATQPAGAAVAYEVFVHDPVVPGIEATFSGTAYRGMQAGYRGGLTGAAGLTTLGTSAAPLTSVNVINPGPQQTAPPQGGPGSGTTGSGPQE